MGSIVGSIAGAVIGNRGVKNATNAQVAASDRASETSLQAARESNALQEKMFNRQVSLYNQDIARQEPIRQAGLAGQNQLLNVLGLSNNRNAAGYGSANAKFQERDIKMDPGYQFRLEQGQKALERSAAARGGLFSGRAAKDLTNYSQGMASQEYGNAYNRAYGRFQDERNNLLQPLQSLAGLAQTATSAQGQAGQVLGGQAGAYGQAGANNITGAARQVSANQLGAGEARASGYIAKAKNNNQMLGGVLNGLGGMFG